MIGLLGQTFLAVCVQLLFLQSAVSFRCHVNYTVSGLAGFESNNFTSELCPQLANTKQECLRVEMTYAVSGVHSGTGNISLVYGACSTDLSCSLFDCSAVDPQQNLLACNVACCDTDECNSATVAQLVVNNPPERLSLASLPDLSNFVPNLPGFPQGVSIPPNLFTTPPAFSLPVGPITLPSIPPIATLRPNPITLVSIPPTVATSLPTTPPPVTVNAGSSSAATTPGGATSMTTTTGTTTTAVAASTAGTTTTAGAVSTAGTTTTAGTSNTPTTTQNVRSTLLTTILSMSTETPMTSHTQKAVNPTMGTSTTSFADTIHAKLDQILLVAFIQVCLMLIY